MRELDRPLAKSTAIAKAQAQPFLARLKSVVEPYIYILPALAFVTVFLIYPALRTVSLSFMDWDGLKPAEWVGLENYRNLFIDPGFQTSVINTIYWVVGALIFPVVLGLIAALVISRVPGSNLFKLLLFLPYVLSGVVIAVMWSFMFGASDGAINALLRVFGLDLLARPWLQQPPLNTFAMIATFTWRMTGVNMVLFLVGLQALPREPIEAAILEGASEWQLTTRIILPMLAPMTAVVMVMSIIHGLNVFDIVWVMTEGGPYRSSSTLAITMYREAFITYRYGLGAAVAVLLSVLVFAASAFYLRVIFKEEQA